MIGLLGEISRDFPKTIFGVEPPAAHGLDERIAVDRVDEQSIVTLEQTCHGRHAGRPFRRYRFDETAYPAFDGDNRIRIRVGLISGFHRWIESMESACRRLKAPLRILGEPGLDL